MIEPAPSPYLVPFDGSFRVADAPTAPPKKPFMRLQVATIICDTLERLPIEYPVMEDPEQAQLDRYKAELLAE